jgi:hypothetical protein
MDDWDELLEEARKALHEHDEGNRDLGEDLTPAPEAHVAGRWRGTGTMATKRGQIDVYLIWDRDDRPGFLYQHARLVQEVDAERPQVGDRVLVLRGPTETFEKGGETRTIYPYVLRRQECSDPLPEAAPSQLEGEDADDELPFLWQGGRAIRSASAAAAVTG